MHVKQNEIAGFPRTVMVAAYLTFCISSGTMAQSNACSQISFPVQSYQYSSMNVPGATATEPAKMNNSGQVVGSYTDSSGSQHGFLFTNGGFTTVDVGADTEVYDLNNSGQFVGFSGEGAFLYTNGIATLVNVPPTEPGATVANGLNDLGQVVGRYSDAAGTIHGFIDTNGAYKTFDIPGVAGTWPQSINVAGQISGYYITSNGSDIGFLDTNGNVVTSSSNPCIFFLSESPLLNNKGEIIVIIYDSTHYGAYAILHPGGSVTVIEPPSGFKPGLNSGWFITGLNDNDQIVGSYYSSGFSYTTDTYFIGEPSVSVLPPIQINIASTLPSVVIGQPYDSGQLAASGGSGSYVWALSAGTLPSGFSLLPTGRIVNELPVEATQGQYLITLRATDKTNSATFGDGAFVLVVLPTVSIVDPVCQTPCVSLLAGPQITTNRNQLAVGGRRVTGISADGVAKVVLQIPKLANTDLVRVTLLSSPCVDQTKPASCTESSSSANNGLLVAVDNAVLVTGSASAEAADYDTSTSTASIIYQAPIDFIRQGSIGTDSGLANRAVYLRIDYYNLGGWNSVSYGSQFVSLTIVRPPVVLIHGLWADTSTWASFSGLTTDPRFYTALLSYSSRVSGVTGSSPSYSASSLAGVRRNAFGFAYNAPLILRQIEKTLVSFKSQRDVAAVQVDVVAHSMGGNLARTLPTLPSFIASQNYDQGVLHKVITIGTPHLGSPVAIQFLNSANNCVSQHLAMDGEIAATTFTIGTAPWDGAVGDLQGDGVGGGLSGPLALLQSSNTHPIPTAFIAGITTMQNLATLQSTQDSFSLFAYCGRILGNPLALDLGPGSWNSVFSGAPNDGIVPLTSQTDQQSIVFDEVPGVVHSRGVEALGFTGPSLLDSPRVVWDVMALLNTPVSNSSSFVSLKP